MAGLGALALAVVLGCGGAADEKAAGEAAAQAEAKAADDVAESVTPPFDVRGELDGLLLVWFDETGQHAASTRGEVPEARREHVRVDSLAVAPDKRLDPEHVYVADLRKPKADGSYVVQKRTRSWLEAHAQTLVPVQKEPSGDVTMYMASWCGACKAAAAYMRSRDVDFVEKDIEKDSGAAAEMQQKAQAAGKQPRGVPVIDFRGTLILGYDQATLASLIDKGSAVNL